MNSRQHQNVFVNAVADKDLLREGNSWIVDSS